MTDRYGHFPPKSLSTFKCCSDRSTEPKRVTALVGSEEALYHLFYGADVELKFERARPLIYALLTPFAPTKEIKAAA